MKHFVRQWIKTTGISSDRAPIPPGHHGIKALKPKTAPRPFLAKGERENLPSVNGGGIPGDRLFLYGHENRNFTGASVAEAAGFGDDPDFLDGGPGRS